MNNMVYDPFYAQASMFDWMSCEKKIELVEQWAEDRTYFNMEFIISIKQALEKYGDLTWRQEMALDNIIRRYKIDDWYMKNDKII